MVSVETRPGTIFKIAQPNCTRKTLDDVVDLRRAAESQVLAVGQHFVEKVTIILLLRGCVDQTRICRRIRRRELPDRFEVPGIRNDGRELLELFELVQIRVSFLFTGTLEPIPTPVILIPQSREKNL